MIKEKLFSLIYRSVSYAILLSLVLSFYLFGQSKVLVVYAAEYGAGTYGGGVYNIGDTSDQPSNNSGSSSSSSNSSSAVVSSCGYAKPDSTPDLFQIDSSNNSLTLFFTPSSGNRDRYYISYGVKEGEYNYGYEFENNESGVVSIAVRSLEKNTRYYFRVRAGNHCQPGDWSNELSAKTGQRIPTFRWGSVGQIVTTNIKKIVSPTKISKSSVERSQTVIHQDEDAEDDQSSAFNDNSTNDTGKENLSDQKQPETSTKIGFWQWFLNIFKW